MGVVARPQGLRGEVIVALRSDRIERMAPGAVLYGPGGSPRLVVAEAHPHQHRWRVFFDGVTDRSEAERLHGMVLYGEPLEVPGVLWVHELVGATVVDTAGRPCGQVIAVEANPASDLLVLEGDFPGERLVPLVFVRSTSPGRVVIDPPEGLFDP